MAKLLKVEFKDSDWQTVVKFLKDYISLSRQELERIKPELTRGFIDWKESEIRLAKEYKEKILSQLKKQGYPIVITEHIT